MKKKLIPASAIICGVLAVVCVVCWGVLGAFAVPPEVEVSLPPSGLSDSVFDLQNMTYEKTAGLTDTVRLGQSGYVADAAPGSEARVGEATLRSASGFLFLYAAAGEGTGTQALISQPITEVLSPGADPLSATVEVLDAASGNLHGSTAEYGLYRISAGGKTGYVSLYRLSPYGKEDAGDLILACMVRDYSTESLANANAFARAMVGSVRESEK